MLTRWQPMMEMQAEMQRLHDEMNRVFGRFGNGSRGVGRTAYPPLNLWEDEGNYYVEAELPGSNLDSLEIYVTHDRQLHIKGERQQPQAESERATWHRQERGYGSFQRLMELPGSVDSEKVTAEFSDGVLTLTLPKLEEAKARRIEVKGS
ncbi:MAG: Hsp20/alpha crystallin family protein [Pirellulaceae bacterium]